jgi:D-alanine-D-alanine ligase
MKKSVAIIYGGYSSEFGISKKSANTVYSNIDTDIFTPYLVGVTKKGWAVEIEGVSIPINRNNFTYTLNEKEVAFDVAFIMIHGTPGEDGKLQSYFDMIELPYVNSGVLASSLTFNKWACNQFLSRFGVMVAKSILLRRNDEVNVNEIGNELSYPCFVKPNDGGSSFGISKVYKEENLLEAISNAFSEGNEVLIEATLVGREVTCGMYSDGKEVVAFPVTEILTENDFFDYEAKYNGASNEVTPANISKELTLEIQTISKKIYSIIGLKAIARVDFIIDSNNVVNVIEVNTIPGMTAESLVPQQIVAAGLKLETVLTEILKS